MLRKNWKILVMGLLVLSLAVVGVGFASAHGDGPHGHPARPAYRIGKQIFSTIADALGMEPKDLLEDIKGGKSILKVAEEKNVGKDELLQAVEDAEKEKLQKLVDEGRITQDQMSWILERSRDRLDNLLEREGTGAFRKHNGVGRSVWSAVADKLGMDEDELRTELRSKSLAAIAAEKGVSMDAIVQAMEDAFKESIQKRVDEGRITQDQADTAVQQFNKHVQECLSQGEGLGCGWGLRAGMNKVRPLFGQGKLQGRFGKAGRGRMPRNGGCRGTRRPAGPGR